MVSERPVPFCPSDAVVVGCPLGTSRRFALSLATTNSLTGPRPYIRLSCSGRRSQSRKDGISGAARQSFTIRRTAVAALVVALSFAGSGRQLDPRCTARHEMTGGDQAGCPVAGRPSQAQGQRGNRARSALVDRIPVALARPLRVPIAPPDVPRGTKPPASSARVSLHAPVGRRCSRPGGICA